MAKEERSSGLTPKLVLAFACMVLLLLSLPSSISMYAVGQNSNSTSSDNNSSSNSSESSSSSDSSDESQASDASSSSTSEEQQTGSDQQSSASNDTQSSNSTDTSESNDENSSSTNSTASSEEQAQDSTQSSDSSQSNSSESNESSANSNATSIDTNSTSVVDQNSNSTSTVENTENPQSQNATSTEAATAVEAVQNSTAQNVPLVTISGEPLVLSDKSITRSFSYPLLEFNGETAAELTVTITWNIDGSTEVSDNRGYRYTIDIPESQGAFSLWYNSTHVDQKVIGPELQYDVYWTAVEGENGYVDKYKYTIAGTSVNGSTISFKVDGGEYDEIKEDAFIISQPASANTPSSFTLDPSLDWTPLNVKNQAIVVEETKDDEPVEDSLQLDWSDAIAAGYQIQPDVEKSVINMPVGKSFVIDPLVIGTSSLAISPSSISSLEGKGRMVTISNNTITRLNIFYYDGSNIVYRTSDDNGHTWSTAISTGTGTLATDTHRWSVISTVYSDTQYVVLLYWTPAGSNMNFYALRGTVSGFNISWGSPILLGYTAANSGTCGSGGACAAVTAATDWNGTIYAAFTWLSGGATDYSMQIMKSSDGGLNWSTSMPQMYPVSTSKPAMALAALNASKMVFVYGKYESSNLFYRIFDGSSWGSEQTISSNGMATNTYKQLSAISNSQLDAYVAYTNVTATVGGILKLVTFSLDGSYQGIETADSTLRHYLPNLMLGSSDAININSLANGKVYSTRKFVDGWEAPFNPYGTTFNSPDQLTAASTITTGMPTALWREGTTSPYNIVYGHMHHGVVGPMTAQNSPSLSDYYEGERRVFADVNGTKYVFYYDGSNIVYKKSYDEGHTWSGTAISLGTGVLASDSFRWTIATTLLDKQYVVVLYWVPSGSNMNFYALRGAVADGSITWNSPVLLGYTFANSDACGSGGACAAAVASTDSDNGYIYAAFRYRSGGSSTYSYQIMRSTDGGLNWSVSLSQVDNVSTNRPVMALTKLNGTKMLFAYALYESAELKYRVFDGTSWGSVQTANGTNMGANTVKQISADTINGTKTAYIAYLSNGNSGTIYVARFTNTTGSFSGIETATSSGSHQLPSMTIGYDDIIRIYTISDGKIYATMKNETGWQQPTTPYGTTFYSADQLTAQIAGYPSSGALWREGTSSPYTLKYDGQNTAKTQVCSHFAKPPFPCNKTWDIGRTGFLGIKTPADNTWRVTKCGFFWQKKYNCVRTSVAASHASSFLDTNGKTYSLQFGSIQVGATGNPFYYWRGTPWFGGGNPQIKIFSGIPADNPSGTLSQSITITVTWVYRSCSCGWGGFVDWKVVSRTMVIPLGYDDTYRGF